MTFGPHQANVTRWFEVGPGLRAGDTLLVYVTDHGTKDPRTRATAGSRSGARRDAGGERARAAARGPRPERAGVMLNVAVLSRAASRRCATRARLDGLRAAKCAATSHPPADRMAYGCYPENRGKDNVGHSFDFSRPCAGGRTSPPRRASSWSTTAPRRAAHPSDGYLTDVLRRAAERRAATDAVHRRPPPGGVARQGGVEPETASSTASARRFGVFSPRRWPSSRTMRCGAADRRAVQNFSTAWKGALGDLADANLGRFLAVHTRVGQARGRSGARQARSDDLRGLATELVRELEPWTNRDAKTWKRLKTLRQKSEAAAAPTYRMEVRHAVVLRMRAILTGVAGRVYLAGRGTPAERRAYEALRACESLTLGTGAPLPGGTTLAAREQFPRFEDDLHVAEQVLPAWMGIRFKPLAPDNARLARVGEGAVTVMAVYPGSPPRPPASSSATWFTRPTRARLRRAETRSASGTMTSRIDEPATLAVRRGAEQHTLTLVPKPYPAGVARAPRPARARQHRAAARRSPPSAARCRRPSPTASRTCSSSGPPGARRARRRCRSCSPTRPRTRAQVFADHRRDAGSADHVSCKSSAARSRRRWQSTRLRRMFLAYGVSGTPTFVLVDGAGAVRGYWHGLQPERGLGFEGWTGRTR